MEKNNLSWLKSGSSYKTTYKRERHVVSEDPITVESDLNTEANRVDHDYKQEYKTSTIQTQAVLSHPDQVSSQSKKSTQREKLPSPPITEDDSLFFSDRRGDRDNLVIDSTYSGDIPFYKKSKIILGFDHLSDHDKASLRRNRRTGKVNRYFQDTRISDASVIQRNFAYDRIRLENRARGIGVDYIDDSRGKLTPELQLEYGDCNSIPFIPLPSDQGAGTISRMELREDRIRRCMERVDMEPENIRSWIHYIAIYDEAADEAENKKERMSMLEMEYQLLSDALKKIPKDSRLLNARLHVLMRLKSGEEMLTEQKTLLDNGIEDGSFLIGYLKSQLSSLMNFSYASCLELFHSILQKMNTHYYSLLRSGVSELDIADYQRCQLSVIYLFACVERMRGGFQRGLQLLRLLLEFNLNAPSLTRGKTLAYKRQLFQSYFVAHGDSLLGADSYESWSDWTQKTLQKMGKTTEATENRSSYVLMDSAQEALQVLDKDHDSVTYEELPSLTPWPCHEPTKKELADLDEQEKMEENQLMTENEDHDYKMVYSRVHGYRIPMPVKDSEQDYYARILKAVKEVGVGIGELNEKKEVKETTQKRNVKVQRISSDDPFVNWLHEEDFEELMASFEEDPDSVVFSDIEPFLINLTPSIHEDLFFVLLQYLGVSLRTKTYALYKRVHEMTITEDEGSLSLLNPDYNLMAEFDDILPIVLSPAVLKDERRQHLIRHIFCWIVRYHSNTSMTFILAHEVFEVILAKHKVSSTFINASLQLSKSYLLHPSHRNAIPLFLSYIDNCVRCSHIQEALRIARGTLQYLERLDSASQRYRPCVVVRLIRCLLLQSEMKRVVTMEGNSETVSLWPSEAISNVQQEIRHGMQTNDESQLDRKLLYLLKTESDSLRETEYQEGDNMFSVFFAVAQLHMLKAYLTQSIEGLIKSSQFIFSLLQPSAEELYPVNYLVLKLHSYKLSLLYNHSLLLFTDTRSFFTPVITQSLLMPKSVLHKEIVTALRDCHEHIPFLVLLSKHDNLNIFAGPLQQYFSSYLKGMENPFILPENKPPEKVILVFVYMLTMILLHKQTYRSTGKGHLPGTFFMRSLFDRLLKIPYLTSSPILWRSYIYYEYNCGHYYNAKHLFYSAINNCPYSKTLWLDCIRILRPVMKNEEIVNVIGYCQTKDILIHEQLRGE